MPSMLSAFYVAIVLVLGSSAQGAEVALVTERDMYAESASVTVDQFHAALKSGDAKAALALLGDKIVIYEEGDSELTRAQYAACHLQADIDFTSGVAETVVRRDASASVDLAWVLTQGRMLGTYRGRAVDRRTTETMVLRRVSDGWKIVHIHWSSKASPPS